MQLSPDSGSVEAAVAEFEQAIGPLFEPHRREMSLLQSKIIEACRKHKRRQEYSRALVLTRCLELVGE